MTKYATLIQKSDALRRKYAETSSYAFAQEVSGLINSAEVNADDTVYADRAASENEWNQIFFSSLEMLLGSHQDKKIHAWFRRNGISF